MIRNLLIINLIVLCFVVTIWAGDIKTLDEAKRLSAEQDKLILLEFYQDDCEYCSKAAQDAINLPNVKNAIDKFIYIKVLEKSDYGQQISKKYFVGIYYPVFYILNVDGEIVRRWTGYTEPQPFLKELNMGLADRSTLEGRLRRFDSSPNFDDAIYLAGYYTEVWDYLRANNYYYQARALGNKGPNAYAYEIFQNAANAAWQDTISFDEALPYADSALDIYARNPKMLVKVAQIMTRLGRKLETTERIGKYIKAAIDATEGRGGTYTKDNTNLKIEYAMYGENNNSKAIQLKKSTLPAGWESNPGQFYGFSKWCLERKINLDEAEALARKAVNMASPGEFRGKVLSTLAHICDLQGKYNDAVDFMNQAVENDPKNKFYPKRLAEFEAKL